MKKLFTKISLLFIGLMLCAGNAFAATEVTHYISGDNLYYMFNVDGVLYNATYTYTAPGNPQIPVQCPLKVGTVSVAGYSGNSNTITIPENVNLPSGIMIMQGNYMQQVENSKKIYSIASDAFTDDDDFNGKTIQMPSTTHEAPALADTWGNTFCSGVTVVFPESEDAKMKYYDAGWPENKVWQGTQQGMWASGTGTINWSYDNNGTLTLSGSGAMPAGSVAIESIPWNGFKKRIKHVVFSGNGITSICHNAFYDCLRLQDVTIPNSITSIGATAFKNDNSLTAVIIDGENSNLETIGEEAFSKCSSLTSIIIPAKVTSIGALAYIACYNVTSITAYGSTPATLSHISSQDSFNTFDGQIVFLGSNLGDVSSTQSMTATVNVPSGKECRYKNAWGEITKNNQSNTVCTLTFANAPEECPEEPEEPEEAEEIASGSCGTDLSWAYYSDGVLTISGTGTTMGTYTGSNQPWYAYKNDIIAVHFDAPNLENIGNYAFNEFQNEAFTEVTIPNSVVSIGNYAFRNCKKLTAIHLGSAVRTIGSSNPFYGCNALTEPIFNEYMFVKMPTSYSGAYTIQAGTEVIQGSAFSGCKNLTSVTIPSSVTTMGTWVFNGCTSLTSASFASSMTSIPDFTFYGCTNITSVTIPDNVTTIGTSAFSGCTALSSVTLGASINSVGVDAFANCPLTSPLKTDTKFFVLPTNYSGAYEIPEGIVEISAAAFKNCKNLTAISIPNSVTTIGSSAFEGCNNTSFTEVTIPNSVTTIGTSAFKSCNKLVSVTMPAGITSLPDFMFSSCTSLSALHMRGLPPTSVGASVLPTTLQSLTFYVPKGTYHPYENLILSQPYWHSYSIVEENVYGDVTAINDEYSYWADFNDDEETVTTYKDAAYNALVASASANEFAANFTIVRPIQANGYLNTICLPFDLSAEQIANSDLADAEIFAFDAQNTGAEIEMVLNEVTEMTAGKPYFFRYPNGTAETPNLGELNFHNVTISTATATPKTVDAGTFRLKGTLQNTLLNSSTNYLFLGAEDALFYPDFGGVGVTNDDLTLRPFRAYFEATGGAINAPARFTFGRKTPTDVESIQASAISNQKIIENGQLFILKNGVKYNVQGQVVK